MVRRPPRRLRHNYIGAAKDFIAALQEPLASLSPELVAEPKVNGSIFRINRDIRFSKDKRPYKDHLDLWFWQGQRKGAISGLFFRLTEDQLILGAGAHGFDKERLAGYRTAIAETKAAQDLLAIEKQMTKHGRRWPAPITPSCRVASPPTIPTSSAC